jgi:hypothetical protein
MFEKGKSGNPNGRPPKGKAITDEIRKYLAETTDEGLTKAQAIAVIWIKKVMDGDTTALKLLVEHLEGKAPQPIVGDNEYDPIKLESTEWKDRIKRKLDK